MKTETWRPPLLGSARSRPGAFRAAVRRFFDLQAGSIWSDLAPELASAHGRVLDVGCGAQPYRELLPADTEYLGIDTVEGRAHFGYGLPDTRYFSEGEWPVEAGWADLIVCTEVLEHVLDPRAFLAEAFRVLRPGGRIVFTVPFAARWHFIPHDYWRFTPSGLNHLLEASGFSHIQVWGRGNRLTVACYKVMTLVLAGFSSSASAGPGRWASMFSSFLLAPLFIPLSVLANISLRFDGQDDCLGFTVLVQRPGGNPP